MAEKFALTAELHLQAPKNVKQVFNQIQNQLTGASVDINVKKSAEAVKDLNRVAKATKNVQNESKLAANSADRMGKAFGSALKNVLRYDLARRVFSAFTNTLEQGTKDAIAFEREMIKIAQVSGQTMKQLKGLQNTVTQLATALGVSSSSLVRTGLILKQTGLSVKDTELAMRALAKTELAPTFDNIADTAETAVAAMRQFGIEAGRLEQLLSKINTVAANFAVEASDIGVAIKRAGGAFKAAGGEVEELIALFTSVRGTTRETAETIATGFRTIFTRLQRPTTIKFLRQFGIELTDLNGKFVGPFEAVKRLSAALKGLDSTDLRFSTIVEQLGGFRQVSKVIPLIQQFGTAQQALNAQLEGSDSLAKDAATAQLSLAVQMQKVTENVKEMFRTMVASDAFQALAKMAIGLANAITKIGKAIAPVLPILGAFVAARAAAWAGGKLLGGGPKGLNKALGSAMGDHTDMFRGNRGGRVRRFSGGGWVPGKGSGDTVPAMLEPGEFVLRKSAAQAFGSRLNGINKYKSGGRSRDVAAARLRLKHTIDGDSLNVDFVPRRRWQNTSTRHLGYDAYESGSDKAVTKGTLRERMLGNLATQVTDKWIQGKNPAQRKALFDAGDAFQQSQSRMKFGRLPYRAGAFGASLVRQGLAIKSETGTGATGNLDKRITKMALGEMETPSTGPAATHYAAWVEKRKKRIESNRRSRAKKKQLNSGGMVPSLLTPGEFVVNKKSAQSFGYGNLRRMNKFAGGGAVGFANGGGVGGGMSSMMNLAFLGNFANSTKEATSSVYSMAEGALFSYTKFQMMGGAANAIGTSLGMGGKTLDAFTGTLSLAGGAVSAFNGVMDKAKDAGWLDAIGGKIEGIKGGGQIGKNIKAGSFGFFATGETNAKEQMAAAKEKQAAHKQEAIAAAEKGKGQVAKIQEAEAELKELLGPRGGLPKGKGAAAKKREIATIKKKIAGHKGEQTKTKNAILKAKDLGKEQGILASKAGKAAKMFKAFNIAGVVAAAAVTKLGDAINKDAMNEIKAGGAVGAAGEKRLANKAALGGAISGAGKGAAIGMVLGPWGAAAGALVGAAWGYFKALEQAKIAILKVKFDKAVESMTNAMKKFTEGQMDASTALGQVVTTLNQTQANAGGATLGESAKTNVQIEKNARLLVKSMADGSKSVSEFDAQLGGNVQSLIDQGMLYDEQIETMREDIRLRVEAQQKLKDYTDAQEQAAKELAKLKSLGTIFDEVEKRMKGFSDIQAGIASPTGAIGFGGGVSNLLSTRTRDPESIKKFESAVDALGNLAGEMQPKGTSKGAGLSGFAGRVKDIGFLERNLETVLTRVSHMGVLGDSAKEEIRSRLGQAAVGEGRTTRAAVDADEFGLGIQDKDLANEINKILGSLEATDLSDIKGNMDKIMGKFMDGQSEFMDQYNKGADLVDKHMERLARSYEGQRSIEQEHTRKVMALSQARFDAETRYIDNISVDQFGGRSNAEIQQNFSERQKEILRRGGAGQFAHGDLDPATLGRNLRDISRDLMASREQLARFGQDPSNLPRADQLEGLGGSTKDLIKKNHELQREYTALTTVLKNYGNTQQRLVILNKELAREKSRQKSLRQLFLDMRFGTAKEKEEASQKAKGLMTVLSTGDIDMLKPEMQRQVVSAIESGLLGEEGTRILKRELERTGRNLGIDVSGITGASGKQKDIAREIRAIELAGITAGEAIASETGTRMQTFAGVIQTQNQNFLNDLKKLMNREADKQLANDEEVARLEVDAIDNLIGVISKMGFDPEDKDTTTKVNWLLANAEKMNLAQEASIRARGVAGDQDDTIANVRKLTGHATLSALFKDLESTGYSLSGVLDRIDPSQMSTQVLKDTGDKFLQGGLMKRTIFDPNRDTDEGGGAAIARSRAITKVIMDMFTIKGGVGSPSETLDSIEKRQRTMEAALAENWRGKNAVIGNLSPEARRAWTGQTSAGAMQGMAAAGGVGDVRGGIIGMARKNFGHLFQQYEYRRDKDTGEMKRSAGDNTFNAMIAKEMAAAQEQGLKTSELFANIVRAIDQQQQRVIAEYQQLRAGASDAGLHSDAAQRFTQNVTPEQQAALKKGLEGRTTDELDTVLQEKINKLNKIIAERNDLGVTEAKPLYVKEVDPIREQTAKLHEQVQAGKEAQKQWKGLGGHTIVAGVSYLITPDGLVPADTLSKTIRTGLAAAERLKQGESSADYMSPLKLAKGQTYGLGDEEAYTGSGINAVRAHQGKVAEAEIKAADAKAYANYLLEAVDANKKPTEEKMTATEVYKLLSTNSDVLAGFIKRDREVHLGQKLEYTQDISKIKAIGGQQVPGNYEKSPTFEALMSGAVGMKELADRGKSKGSIYTHDTHVVAAIESLIQVMSGGGSGDVLSGMRGSNLGVAGTQVADEKIGIGEGGFSETIQTFSKSVDQLSKLMQNPLDISVSGTIKMDIKVNGAAWFQDASDSLMLLAGKQVTDGINSFIKHGLKDARVNTNVDWVSDPSTNSPLSGNNSGGATA